jgi:hypothetical protein
MAKRFTDTDKWKKPFIRLLDAPYKLLWFYILDDCDHAGIWQADFEVASIRIGMKVTEEKMKEKFGERIIQIAASKFFLPDFIFFQYGCLNEKNRLHLSVINILKKYQIEGLLSSLEGAKEQYKDKEQDKDRVKDKEQDTFGKSENLLIIPQMLNVFKKHNPKYLSDKNKDYKPLFSIAQFFCTQAGFSGSPDQHNLRVLETWEIISKVIAKDNFYSSKSLLTISNHIQEITQTALHGKSNSKNGKQDYGSKERAKEYDRMFAERYGSGGSATGKNDA